MKRNRKTEKQSLRFEVLSAEGRRLLPKLGFLRQEYDFYLAGGTALALQIGHRTSADFDFYSQKEFDSKKVLESFRRHLRRLILIRSSENTLIVRVAETGASVFYYPYSLLRPVAHTEYLNLASKQDIAAMKLVAILQRGNMRDFVDVYFLMKEFTLEEIFRWTKRKFPPFNPYIGARALSYFKDAEKDSEKGRFQLIQKVNWEKVKQEISEKVTLFIQRELHV